MNKRVSLLGAVVAVFITAVITFTATVGVGVKIFGFKPDNDDSYTVYDKLEEIDQIVRSNYIGDIDDGYLNDCIAMGYMMGIDDDYAYYYPADSFDQFTENISGEHSGIGITVAETESGVEVLEVVSGSPADTEGIEVGDIITAVNGEELAGLVVGEAVEKMTFDIGTRINFEILRGDEAMDISLVTAEYDIVTVKSRNIDGCAVIRITEFNYATVEQFCKAVQAAVSGNARGIVFDLRDNGGGTLESIEGILDYLLPEGPVISVRYADGEKKVIYTSDANEVDIPMAVLVNGNTASAAELFTASLRDYDKAVIVGETTFGKGVMQATRRLSDGSAIKMTIAEYYPPKGDNYDGIGISPDIESVLPDGEIPDYNAADASGDTQLAAALASLNG